jgi:hypothetical protein
MYKKIIMNHLFNFKAAVILFSFLICQFGLKVHAEANTGTKLTGRSDTTLNKKADTAIVMKSDTTLVIKAGTTLLKRADTTMMIKTDNAVTMNADAPPLTKTNTDPVIKANADPVVKANAQVATKTSSSSTVSQDTTKVKNTITIIAPPADGLIQVRNTAAAPPADGLIEVRNADPSLTGQAFTVKSNKTDSTISAKTDTTVTKNTDPSLAVKTEVTPTEVTPTTKTSNTTADTSIKTDVATNPKADSALAKKADTTLAKKVDTALVKKVDTALVKKSDTTAMAKDTSTAVQEIKAQSVFLEVGGPGLAISGNYDTRFAKQRNGWGYRIGAGYFGSGGNTVFTIPFQINYLYGEHSSLIELGAGTTFLNSTGDNKGSYWEFDKITGFIATATIGYRYQPAGSGLTFRIAFVPILYDEGILPIGGISVGYTFK